MVSPWLFLMKGFMIIHHNKIEDMVRLMFTKYIESISI
jgi:hypothetical protein